MLETDNDHLSNTIATLQRDVQITVKSYQSEVEKLKEKASGLAASIMDEETIQKRIEEVRVQARVR